MYTFKFGDFMNLGNLAKNIYNGNISVDVAKKKKKRKKKKKTGKYA